MTDESSPLKPLTKRQVPGVRAAMSLGPIRCPEFNVKGTQTGRFEQPSKAERVQQVVFQIGYRSDDWLVDCFSQLSPAALAEVEQSLAITPEVPR